MKRAPSSFRLQRMLPAMAISLCLAAPVAVTSANAQAAPPAQQNTQVPGYHRMMLGQFEITALYDGFVGLDQAILHGAPDDEIGKLIAAMFVPTTPQGAQTAVNAFLVNTGKQLILVDSGAAACFGPTMGSIVGNMQAAGYQPAQVDTVLLTHLHGDHVCGITHDGAPVFPNATVYVDSDEAAYWLDKETAAQAPDAAQPFFTMAQQSIAPYVAKNQVKQFKSGDTLMEGVKSWPLPGHTPGHGGYQFSSDGQDLLFWGDIVHSHAVQFSKPEVSIEFDTDPEKAVATRKEVFEQAASQKLWIAGAHLPFPGIGHVASTQDGAYDWVPLEYTPLPR
ncbi:MBL fold metallo-hydrolase [Allopusillimonas ginsengisoli]|uniref:MBL fold metallo-hydrolase n=1 Tax=Allopusillimonas ginsengisoli TaxID=453575 RepID=UPI001020550A|nr:MBL fold metallo-hydrolase [Allopusillimonas ginsengisoli]TEA79797.1 MBL fold metallo-hydrolase [Allopusillimonas ginsengisoli]